MNTYRLFSIVCYDESDTTDFKKIFSHIVDNNLNYIYIKHDKDENKIHYHIAIYTKQATTIKKISNLLDIKENYISIKDDYGKRYTLKNTIGYFLHYNNNDKHNYEVQDLFSNDYDLVNKYYDLLTGGKNETNSLKEILQFINYNKVKSISSVLDYCIDNDLLKTFKKYSYILNQIVKENY